MVGRKNDRLLPIEDGPLNAADSVWNIEMKCDLSRPLFDELGRVEDDDRRHAATRDPVERDHRLALTARQLQDAAARGKKRGHRLLLNGVPRWNHRPVLRASVIQLDAASDVH